MREIKPYKRKSLNTRLRTEALGGAADRTWTGTVLLPRDFKSLASAYSATAANGISAIMIQYFLYFVKMLSTDKYHYTAYGIK